MTKHNYVNASKHGYCSLHFTWIIRENLRDHTLQPHPTNCIALSLKTDNRLTEMSSFEPCRTKRYSEDIGWRVAWLRIVMDLKLRKIAERLCIGYGKGSQIQGM